MGEYFSWINIDKKEYISPWDFDLGSKSHESMQKDNELLKALRNLLTNEWKGDRILFLGDDTVLSDRLDKMVIDTLYNQWINSEDYDECYSIYQIQFWDHCECQYKNVSAIFKAAEKQTKEEIALYCNCAIEGKTTIWNEYGINLNNPYENLFKRDGQSFRFTINLSKGIAYSSKDTKVFLEPIADIDNLDPLPILLGFGRTLPCGGPWIGDIITVSDELSEEIQLVEKIIIDCNDNITICM